MELFDFLDALFDKNRWKTVSDTDKYKFFYMTNRFLSIRYPVEINNTQIIGLGGKNSARMMDFWHMIVTKHHKRPPNWLRTKSGKKPVTKDVLKGIDKPLIAAYCNNTQIDSHKLVILCEMFPKELKADIKAYSKNFEDRTKKTKKKVKS